ncbi:hypothetical protein LguiA_007722 [Lonicera macranthoides]
MSFSCKGSLEDNHSESLGAFSHDKYISLEIKTYIYVLAVKESFNLMWVQF